MDTNQFGELIMVSNHSGYTNLPFHKYRQHNTMSDFTSNMITLKEK
jgi:hypothetical protein